MNCQVLVEGVIVPTDDQFTRSLDASIVIVRPAEPRPSICMSPFARRFMDFNQTMYETTFADALDVPVSSSDAVTFIA